MADKYDLVVVGGGPGGIEAAKCAGTAGKRVLIIEKSGWGGTCTHRGCIPTKALLACSKHYADLKKLKRLGINVASAGFDFAAIKKHQQQMVKTAALGAQKILADANVTMKTGEAEILSAREILTVDPAGEIENVTTDNIVIAWGSETQILPEISLSERILTSDSILNLDFLPGSIVIIGGSFIGIELATFLAELGVRVTLIEMLERILPQEDEEAAALLMQEMTRAGIAVHTGAQLTAVTEKSDRVFITARKKSGQVELSADYALLCTGRKPSLRINELERIGISYDRRGIKVNEQMMTSVAGIYAVGDVTGGMMLAHRAAEQGKVAACTVCGLVPPQYNENFIPSVVYSHPQVAHVGFTKHSAYALGINIEVLQSGYGANIIARTELLGQGFAQALFYQDKIIGATLVGEHAADLIAPLALAVSQAMTRKQLRSWVIPHPTLSEIFTTLL